MVSSSTGLGKKVISISRCRFRETPGPRRTRSVRASSSGMRCGRAHREPGELKELGRAPVLRRAGRPGSQGYGHREEEHEVTSLLAGLTPVHDAHGFPRRPRQLALLEQRDLRAQVQELPEL